MLTMSPPFESWCQARWQDHYRILYICFAIYIHIYSKLPCLSCEIKLSKKLSTTFVYFWFVMCKKFHCVYVISVRHTSMFVVTMNSIKYAYTKNYKYRKIILIGKSCGEANCNLKLHSFFYHMQKQERRENKLNTKPNSRKI